MLFSIFSIECTAARGRRAESSCNHDQTTSVQKEFEKDVTSLMLLKSLIGNPFEEENKHLLVLDTKEIAEPAAIETVQNASLNNFVRGNLQNIIS